MKATETNLLDWQKRYGKEASCAKPSRSNSAPEGFGCPQCGHNHSYNAAETK